MKNRVNGFLCVKKCFFFVRLQGNQQEPPNSTTWTVVEEKEKFFEVHFIHFEIVLSLFVSFSSSSRGFIGEVLTLNFPTTSLEFPQSTLSREDTRILKEQQE